MKKKTLSMVMGLILGVTTVFGSIGTTAVTVSAASGEVTDADCADNNTDAPAADKVVPDANQYKYQKDELAAFCHFGPNTFNEVEWGAQAEKLIQNNIETLREQNVDLILACCHWGIEKDTYPENYQQVLGRKCIDWGVDLVIGHHPHVLQGIEEYKGRYIIYSLANFCFGANRNPADKDTMIFQQTFTFENGQKVEDRNARIIPCMVSSVSTRNDFKPTPAAGEDKKRILQRMNEYSRDFGVEFDENGGILVN